ncbi:oligosaccharide flippase family protein [Candidatus Peregrinibacteria bacterium]|nr:MAG: oligosaccharide flippase family protein [Candidatus Peregrinibacteria bacterium]
MKKKIFQESVWSFSSKGVGILLFFLNSSLLAHLLGKEVFGQWIVLFSLFSLCHFFTLFGVNDYLRKELVQSHSKEYRKIVFPFFVVRGVVTLFSGILLFFFVDGTSIFSPVFISIILTFLIPFLLLYGILDFLHQIFFGLHRIKYSFFLSCIEQISFFSFLFCFSLIQEITLESVFIFHLLSFFLAVVFGAFFFLYQTRAEKNTPLLLFDRKTYFSLFFHSFPYFVVQAGTYFFSYIDILLLGIVASPVYAGVYGIAKNVVSKIPHINTALSLSFSPVFSNIARKDAGFQEKKNILLHYVFLNIIILVCISIGILLFSDIFVRLIWGNTYQEASFFLRLLIPYMISFSLLSSFGAILDYNNAIRKRAIIYISSSVLFLLLFFVLKGKLHAILISLSLSCVVASFAHFILLFQKIFNKDTQN